jgi:hypothetical protein
MTAKFFRDKHNIQTCTAPTDGINSVFEENVVLTVSAYISASGTAIAQPGRATGFYAQVPGCFAGITPSGSTIPTGFSNHWFIAQAGNPNNHLMAYSKETISALSACGKWIPTSYSR